MKLTLFWLSLSLIGLARHSQAQPNQSQPIAANSNNSATEIDWAHFELTLEENPEKWTFKLNPKQQNMLVDFEQLAGIPQKLLVLSQSEELMFEDAYLDGLGKNTIYEINLQTMPAGNYIVMVENELGEKMRYEFEWQR